VKVSGIDKHSILLLKNVNGSNTVFMCLSPEACNIKLLAAAINSALKKVGVFAIVSHFHSSLIFASKAIAYYL